MCTAERLHLPPDPQSRGQSQRLLLAGPICNLWGYGVSVRLVSIVGSSPGEPAPSWQGAGGLVWTQAISAWLQSPRAHSCREPGGHLMQEHQDGQFQAPLTLEGRFDWVLKSPSLSHPLNLQSDLRGS